MFENMELITKNRKRYKKFTYNWNVVYGDD